MTRILVVSTPGLSNKGSEAVVRGAIECIAGTMPQSKITFLCHQFDADRHAFAKMTSEDVTIRVIRHPWYRESNSRAVTAVNSGLRFLACLAGCGVLRVASKLGIKSRNPFFDCDLVLDLNTDALNEYYKGVFPPVFVLANIALGIVAGKPVAVCAASVAPFRGRGGLKALLKLVLNQVDLITVREEFSLEHLKTIGITRPRVGLTADLSFLSNACPEERINDIARQEKLDNCGRPLIGVALVHHSLYTHPDRYLSLMAEAADALVKELDANLIFVPNCFSGGMHDESATIDEIHGRTHLAERIGRIKGEYSAAEIKGIISRCDLVLSAKFHPLLFAASMGVPSVGLVGYHRYKFHGVVGRMLGQEDYLVDIDDYPDNESLLAALLSKVRLVWQNRDAVRESLTEKSETARQLALANGGLIRNLLQAETR